MSTPGPKLGLVTLEQWPFNAETPLGALGRPITPTSLFYVRNHFAEPDLHPSSWRLLVDGRVERPLELSLADLHALPVRNVTVTLECAGNGRGLMAPLPPGTPWRLGAAGTARFTGTPLRNVLDPGEPGHDVVEVLFTGADAGAQREIPTEAFARSLPLEAARSPDVLLAWAMNGEPLTRSHGFPLRLIVPGWYGVASVKWLVRVTALAEPFEGYFQRERYVYVGEPGTRDGSPVTRMRVRAVIARPAEGAEIALGPIQVMGSAWSGDGPIRLVEVSADGGRSWSPADVMPGASPYAASAWRFGWKPPGRGCFELLARATDDAGNTQPLQPLWNQHGYGNNAVHRVTVRVR